MPSVSIFAPAKVNLALHVTDQRPDGYHVLDSLVAFAGVGDKLELRTSGPGRLTLSGPEAEHVPADESNLILKVADAFWPSAKSLSCHLDKRLPAAAGLGGGSADAAACYRGLLRLHSAENTAPALLERDASARLFALGADIPMCVLSEPARVEGVGEQITPVPLLPEFPVVLVNPRVEVPTASVFSALTKKVNSRMEDLPDEIDAPDAVLAWLSRQRNDLLAPAQDQAPVIGDVLKALRGTPGCRLARMSGSGATCFGLYDSDVSARAAATAIRSAAPGWWVEASRLDGARRAAAQEIRATT